MNVAVASTVVVVERFLDPHHQLVATPHLSVFRPDPQIDYPELGRDERQHLDEPLVPVDIQEVWPISNAQEPP